MCVSRADRLASYVEGCFFHNVSLSVVAGSPFVPQHWLTHLVSVRPDLANVKDACRRVTPGARRASTRRQSACRTRPILTKSDPGGSDVSDKNGRSRGIVGRAGQSDALGSWWFAEIRPFWEGLISARLHSARPNGPNSETASCGSSVASLLTVH